jgi:hypothetical protein
MNNVQRLGAELEKLGYVKFGNKAYNQSGDNCFEIAKYIAEKHGFQAPNSKKELTEQVYEIKKQKIWSGDKEKPSRANLMIRTKPNQPLSDVHVTFEMDNKEYNYGPAEKDGYTIDTRIPLKKE